MKVREKKLVPILFALAGVLFLIPAVKSVIKGQPLDVTFIGLAVVCLVLGVVLGRQARGGSGPPSA